MILSKDNIFPNEEIRFHINDETHFFPHLHSHDFYEVFVVLSGSICHQINADSRELPVGSLQLVHPDDRHQIDVRSNGRSCNIALSGRLMEQLLLLIGMDVNDLPRECVLLPDDLTHCASECKKIAALPNQQSRDIHTKSLLFFCLTQLVKEPAPVRETCPEWLSILLSRLSEPSVFTMSTREICALAGYTPEYVSRCFRRYLDTTLTDHLLNRRLQYAEGLLVSTNLPILDICLECGFRNLNYFYRCFHNVYGISPKKYRNQNSVLL